MAIFAVYFDVNLLSFFLCLCCILLPIYLRRSHQAQIPTWKIATLPQFQIKASRKIIFFRIATWCYYLSWFFLAIAVLRPYYKKQFEIIEHVPKEHSEGVKGIHIVLDNSSSMLRNIDSPFNPVFSIADGKSRLEYSKEILANSVIRNPVYKGDIIALHSFARFSQTITPLTTEREILLQKCKGITPVSNEKEDGTSLGYAIFKVTVNAVLSSFLHSFQPQETSQNIKLEKNIIIVLTDGFPDLRADDQQSAYFSTSISQAAEFALRYSIPVYVIGIDPTLLRSEFKNIRMGITKTIQTTGGNFYITEDKEQIEEFLHLISEKESDIKKGQNLSKTYKIGYIRKYFYLTACLFSLFFLFIYFVFKNYFT